MPFAATLSNFFEERWTQNYPQYFSELLQLFLIAVYTAISKKVVEENGERRMFNGGCTTERNSGYAISYAKFHKLPSPCVKINTNYERFSEGSWRRRQKKLALFQLKNVPRCLLVWTAYYLRLYIASHKKFRNIALNCSFRNAQEKWSLCNRMLKNMDKSDNLQSKVFIKWSWHHWLA